MTKRCSSCKRIRKSTNFTLDKTRPEGLQRYCKEFVYERTKRWQQTHQARHYTNTKRYVEKYPERQAARAKVKDALRSGKLIKHPCKVCGTERVHAHHPDWTKPLDVVWLCPPHHKQAHKPNA
jgi:hypothetical protein